MDQARQSQILGEAAAALYLREAGWKGRVVEACAEARKLFGWGDSALPKEAFSTLLHPDDRDRVRGAWEKAREEGGAREVSYRVLTAGGLYRMVLDRGVYKAPTVDFPEGQVSGLWLPTSGAAQDTTYRHVFEASAEAHLIIDKGLIVDCNRAAMDMLGYTRADSVIGYSPMDFSPTHQPGGRPSSERVREVVELALAQGFHRFEWLHLRADGGELPVEVTLNRIHLWGRPCLLAVWHDLTRIKAASRTLEQFKHCLDSTHDCIFMFLPDGSRFTYVNRGAVQQVEYSEAELLRMGPLDIKPHMTPERLQEMLQMLRSGREQRITFETVHRSKSGNDAPVEITLQFFAGMEDGGRFFAIARDIAERKAAEKALRESENRFRDIAYASGEYFWEVDAEGRYTYVTSRVEHLLGLPASGILGRTPFDFMPLPERGRVRNWFLECVRKAEPFRHLEHASIDRAGKKHWQRVSGEPMFDEQGAVTGYRGSGLDITGERQKSEELRQFVSLVENSADFIGMSTLEGQPFYVNNAGRRMVGLNTAADISKLHIIDFVAQESREPFAFRIVPEAVQKGRWRGEVDLQRFDNGAVVTVEMSLFQVMHIDSGEPICLATVSRDVTRQKQDAKALRESERRLELALAGGDLALWDWHIPSGHVYFNDRWATMLGYAAGELEHHVSVWEGLMHPDDLPGTKAILEQHFAQETEFYSATFRMRTKQGDWYWILARGQVVERDGLGGPLRMVGTHMEITEQVRTEQALRLSEERFSNLFHHSSDGILLYGIDGRIIDANQRMLNLVGYEREELVKLAIEHLHPPRAKGLACDIHEHNSSEYQFYEVDFRRRDHSIFRAEVSSSVYQVGGERLVQGVVRDITERKFNEEALRKSEERYYLAVRGSNDGLWDWDIVTNWVYWSPRFKEQLGYRIEDLEATYETFFDHLHPDDRDQTAKAIEAHLERRVPYDMEHRLRTKEGAYRWFRVRGQALWSDEGEPIRMAGSLTDITNRKKAEEAVARAREYERLVESRIEEGLLRTVPPAHLRGVEIACLTIPSQHMDGDFYDFIPYSETCFDLMIGDVMGKGIQAALIGAGAKNHFARTINRLMASSDARQLPRPEDIVTRVNVETAPQLIALETFFTLCYVRFDLNAASLEYVDCGHTKSIVYRSASGACDFLEGDNLPIGFHLDEDYGQRKIELDAGDVLLFYSDGVTESRGQTRELFGSSRLREAVCRHGKLPAGELLQAVRDEVEAFRGAAGGGEEPAPNDDFTCIAVRVERVRQGLPQSRPQGHLWSTELRVAGHMSELKRTRRFVRELCDATGILGKRGVDEFELAVNEAVANVIAHAFHHDIGKEIRLLAHVEEARIRIELHYEGSLFPTAPPEDPCPDEAPPGLEDLDMLSEGGRGLLIINAYTDAFWCEESMPGQVRVCLLKESELADSV